MSAEMVQSTYTLPTSNVDPGYANDSGKDSGSPSAETAENKDARMQTSDDVMNDLDAEYEQLERWAAA